MTDLSEIRALNNITRTVFKTELSQFYGIIFAVLSSLCYRCDSFRPDVTRLLNFPFTFQLVFRDCEISR